MTGLEHIDIQTNGMHLHTVQAGPQDGPLVVLLHGFPEFWYSWRNQLEPLAEAGYRVVAPDQRGYNLSDKPPGMAAYRVELLAADVVGLIDALGREKAYLAGHDWGAAVACGIAVAAVAGVLMERLAFRPLRNASFLTLLFASFALSVLLQNLFRAAVSPR